MYGLRSGTEKCFRRLATSYVGGTSELSDEQKEELKSILKERDDWTTKEVKELIKIRFGVEYSLRDMSRILITM
ncbi:hypothetical protein AIOGIFDO_00865 [Candidatus Methanoperedenaceae archaeon GB37]|nr:hypothetical protein AIOGIFDO_00865 [Candidatus Methanoperedenaceae archaeon GB37]